YDGGAAVLRTAALDAGQCVIASTRNQGSRRIGREALMATRARAGTARAGTARAGTRASGARRGSAESPAVGTPRTGAKRTVMYYIRQLPQYVRLLAGLARDPRVSMVDKMIVLGAIAYIVMPIDLIPDFIPFFGEIDDVYILVLALQRLI